MAKDATSPEIRKAEPAATSAAESRPTPAPESTLAASAAAELETGDDGHGGGEPALLPDIDDDNDSALGADSVHSETASLSSSVMQYRVENGRTYHAYKAGSYILPNDEVENDRLDLQHHVTLLTLDNKLHLCPAGREGKKLGRVLDAGCGTGIWSLDFADEHPETHIIGVDLSPIQPTFVPPNVSFYVDDLEAEWTYSQPFDFIYMRMLSASIASWPKLFEQSYMNLYPGGWIELLDPLYPLDCDDGTLAKDSALYRWSVLLNEAATKLGSSLDSSLTYPQQLAAAGFARVEQRTFKWPINTWPADRKHKQIGAYSHENIMTGLQALSLALFTRALGWSVNELEVFLSDVRRDLKNRNIHAYWSIVVTYGQKPE